MKIGFIALSGVRVVDPVLLAAGVNMPGFVERSKVIASLPSLGLLTLAALTPVHHEIHYIEVPELTDELPGSFDVVALSSFTAMIEDAYILADRYRQAGTKVILGGLHVTLCPDEAERHADAIVIGEAEPVWENLLADIEKGNLKRRYASTQPFDLAQAPLPRFDLLDIGRYNRLTVQTSRSCPWLCEFCASSIVLQPVYRTKPVDKIMEEIDAIKSIWDKPFIEFADDNSFVKKKHSHALMDALRGQNIRWFTETDISVADDPALLKKMHDAGCAQILIGFEDPGTGTEGIELRSNWKARQQHKYLESIKRIQDHGITVNGCFVLGLDTHHPDVFDRMLSFIEESELYEVQLTLMTPFPNTPMFRRLDEEGRLRDHDGYNWRKKTLFDITFQPKNMTTDELHDGFIALAEKVYSASATSHRRRNFMKHKISSQKQLNS
jgi:Fe-S oxidoreductase